MSKAGAFLFAELVLVRLFIYGPGCCGAIRRSQCAMRVHRSIEWRGVAAGQLIGRIADRAEAADEQSRRCDDRMSMLLRFADRNRAAVTHLIKNIGGGS